jgi:hypothetical protein
MEKEEVLLVAQLLAGIKDAIERMEDAWKRKDVENLNAAKKEILNFQKQIDEIL